MGEMSRAKSIFPPKVWQSSDKDTLARSKEVRNLTLSIGVMVAAIAACVWVKLRCRAMLTFASYLERARQVPSAHERHERTSHF